MHSHGVGGWPHVGWRGVFGGGGSGRLGNDKGKRRSGLGGTLLERSQESWTCVPTPQGLAVSSGRYATLLSVGQVRRPDPKADQLWRRRKEGAWWRRDDWRWEAVNQIPAGWPAACSEEGGARWSGSYTTLQQVDPDTPLWLLPRNESGAVQSMLSESCGSAPYPFLFTPTVLWAAVL
ncbi:hypothetical protein VTK73DRAFT_6974 [Phialemonium thermophilum]|uniref:Uncharacterized protein n=1 Tax=Phialemonium thermophilum TaxID=223376 RepID=A0ABR3WH25_9PEZI